MGKHDHKEKQKKHKKEKKKHKKREKKRHSSSSSSGSSEDEWVEKKSPPTEGKTEEAVREHKRPQDDWDLFSAIIPAASRPDRKTERDEAKRKEREANQYDPSKCARELNPYWKDGGDGLPSSKFLKPSDNKEKQEPYKRSSSSYSSSSSNWRKKTNSSGDYSSNRDESRCSNSNWRKGSYSGGNEEAQTSDGGHSSYKKDSESSSSTNSHWRRSRDNEDSRMYSRAEPSDNRDSEPSKSNWRKSSNNRDNEDRRTSSRDHYSDQRDSDSTSRKRSNSSEERRSPVPSTSRRSSPPKETSNEETEVLTDKQLNELAAKLVKAEIMGNDELAASLKRKLENARNAKKQESKAGNDDEDDDDEGVILTSTDAKGFSRPVRNTYSESDKYGGRKGKKKQKVETHDSGNRVRYFADDDKYSLQQMYENEKFSNTREQQEAEFVKMAGKIAKNDDLDDSYTDKIRREECTEKSQKRAKDAAIGEHQKISKSLDTCSRCLQSPKMDKHLMIALGQTAHLTLPPHEPLTEGHCVIVPNRHVPCGTQLDENEWEEIMDLRKSLTRMFAENGEDVIFFEIATGLHRMPHMTLECVPVPKEEGDMAPIYFKKAIDECEMEWATNKKLVSLAGRDVRRAVPKGLSYFCVSFGMDEGYAHVIEDQALFPGNFAQEIIGGMLDLHHSKWRKPRREQFDVQKERVLKFSKSWVKYDCTNNT